MQMLSYYKPQLRLVNPINRPLFQILYTSLSTVQMHITALLNSLLLKDVPFTSSTQRKRTSYLLINDNGRVFNKSRVC